MIPLIVIGAIGCGGPAFAIDVHLAKHTAAELKSDCDKAGGRFSQDAHGYGCGTDCKGKPGTACEVFCQPGKRCVAQVIEGKRPRHVLDALQALEKHHH